MKLFKWFETAFFKNEIRLDIFGISEAEIKLKYNIVELGNNIHIHGKVKQEEINNFIVKADLRFLLDLIRIATDMVFRRSLLKVYHCVPVATNLTSDLGFIY
jgi:hypothetical protein